MRLRPAILVSVGVALGATSPASSAAPVLCESEAATAPVACADIPQLLTADTGASSYLDGRDFQSYQQDRGFGSNRSFGGYPSTPAGPRDDSPYSLKQPRIHAPGDNRCADWSKRCELRTGDAPGDYERCMRYHGCR